MGKCVIKGCCSKSQKHNKSTGITFHTVPKDEARRDKWVKIIRLLRKETDWLPTKFTLICSKHFHDHDKIIPKNKSGRVYLSEEAIPILFDGGDPEQQEEDLVEKILEVELLETDEEIQEIIETQREHKMRLTIDRLKNTCARRLGKIKNLSKSNKRLTIKCNQLNNVIEELKKNGKLTQKTNTII